MLFASLLASALAVLGTVSAAPLDAPAAVQVDARSPDTPLDAEGLLPRKPSLTLQTFVDRVQDNPFENDETYVTRLMDALTDRYPKNNIFIFHRNRGFTWAVEKPNNALEATATHDYPLNQEYFGVVVFKTAGWLKKSSDGGYGNWRVSGAFTRTDDNTFTFRAIK